MFAQMIKKGSLKYKTFPQTPERKKEYTLQFYEDHLSRHFAEEENLLFPFIKGKNIFIDKLSDELTNEHRIITEIIHSLKDKNRIEEKLDRLGTLLISHIRKEERELFPKIQKEFNEEDLLILEQKLKS
jgi:iron-sulfur cluster repair protein YtfE (RIC family)